MEISPANSTPARIASWKSGAIAARTASLNFAAPLPLALWHLTSLDAPTVAVVWALAFAWAAGISLPLWLPILLALVAWAVYIADRLLDARSAHHTHQLHRLRLRHHFHWRHRQIFLPLAVISACAATVLVLTFMPVGALQRNTVLAVAALAYFSGVHVPRRLLPFPRRNIIPKEPIVAILFTTACVLPTLSRTPHQSAFELWPLILPALFFTLLAWLNCHAIESWEHWESAGAPSHSSVFAHTVALAVTGLILSLALAAFQPRSAALVAAGTASALFLALLDRQRSRISPLALRAAADLALLTPAFFTPILLAARILPFS